MDYRHYRGDRLELSPSIVKHLHLLRYIGALMIATPPILAVLMLLNVIKPSLFLYFVSILLGTFGNVFFIVGMAYNSIVDRDDARGTFRKVAFFRKKKAQNDFRAGRKMIYDHYEAPDVTGKGDMTTLDALIRSSEQGSKEHNPKDREC